MRMEKKKVWKQKKLNKLVYLLWLQQEEEWNWEKQQSNIKYQQNDADWYDSDGVENYEVCRTAECLNTEKRSSLTNL